MYYCSVRVRPVPWLDSSGATAHIFLVLDHRHLTNAGHRWSISGMGFGVGRRITAKCGRSLAVNHSGSDRAMHLHGILIALETFAAHGATLHVFHMGLHSLVRGMTAAERVESLALFVPGVIDALG